MAQVGTTTPSTGGSGSSGSSGEGDPTAYAACMRRNGVPDFPDPDSNGHFAGGREAKVRVVNSPKFRTAAKACQKLLPSGRVDPQEQARARQQSLAFSRCMRSRGVAKFPDPLSEPDGSTKLRLGDGVNPNSPLFQAAQRACDKLVPGMPRPGAESSQKQ